MIRPTTAAAPPETSVVVAAFDPRDLRVALDALRARGCSVQPIAVPARARRVVAQTVDRAAVVATLAGAVAAPVGAVLLRGEAYLPTLGWLPVPAVAAAAFAGAIGALAFAIAVIVLLSRASLASPVAEPSAWLIAARVRPELLRDLVASHGGALLSS